MYMVDVFDKDEGMSSTNASNGLFAHNFDAE
jgi:hypothetical protein